MTGLALTTVGLAPAANANERPRTTAGDHLENADQPSTDNHRKRSREQGRGGKPQGTPVPCDTDALIATITLANARGGATLDLAKDCTYLLTADIDGAGLPAITTPITLNGGKHTTIERAAAVDEFRILTVDVGGDLTLNKLKLIGGRADGNGGAILVNSGGALTTNHSTITRNIADGDGGGIAANGTTRIAHSIIERNTASTDGGGVAGFAELQISKSRVRANAARDGAGVASAGTVRIEQSSVSANHARGNAGGIFVDDGSGFVVDTEVTDNVADVIGGVFADNRTQITLESVAIIGNLSGRLAGGLGVDTDASAVATNSVIKNNNADDAGGGIYNISELVLRNTKVIGNQAGSEGGGIYNEAPGVLTLFATKVMKNIAVADGGGIFNEAGGTVNLNTATGTVVIKNRPNNCSGDVPGCAG